MLNSINRIAFFEYPCESHIECHPLSIELNPGIYSIQCFGASGGDTSEGKGGYGAYVGGILKLLRKKTLYLYIGAEGHLDLGKPSYNGGGRGHLEMNEKYKGASGGGATDIRLINNSNIEGLISRIIVAGGGGGGISYGEGSYGGDAGTFEGDPGIISVFSDDYIVTTPLGGNQTSGGSAGHCLTYEYDSKDGYEGTDGSFGFGGNGPNKNYGAGGGGGYFGGGGGSYTNGKVTSGAGGSSYISGQKGCHSFDQNTNNSSELIDIDSPIHKSGIFFTSINFLNGSQTKYKGNGRIIISLISFDYSSNRCLNIKINCLKIFIFIMIIK